MTSSLRMDYAVAPPRDKFRIASDNPDNLRVVRRLLNRHEYHIATLADPEAEF